jgi:leader peptidase (prepilin peptidase)/N-methyltransferase
MIESVIAGLFGLLIGSFLNVCIYRWPRDLSVVRPRSACIACRTQIAWYDNIPVLSYFILRGRCRQCGARIHWRYPVVELMTAISFGWFVHVDGLSVEAAKYCVFSAIVIALVFCDLETLILPDEFTIGGLLIGLVFALFAPGHVSLGDALLGATVPAGSIWLGGWLFEKLRHKQGLGFGDVKMLAMAGAFLGIRGALLTIILGSLAGAVVGVTYIKATGKDAASYPLPFGSFLGAAALVAAVAGQSIADWYLRSLS